MPYPKYKSGYQNSSDRARESRSSGWVLLLVGVIGLLILALGITGVAPLKFGDSYLFCSVMAAVFLLFFIFGIVSMKDARIFEKKAKTENSLRDTMLEWCNENLHAEEIDQQIVAKDRESEEMLYFMRFGRIKARLNRQFVNLDQDFLENFIYECVYDTVFKEEG